MAQSLEAQTILDPLPVASTPGAVGGGMMPTRYAPAIEVHTPELEIDSIEHQWRVFQSDITESGATLTVRGGKVEWGIEVTADEITLDAPTTEKVIWCEITVDSGTQEAVSALIESGDTIPEDTDTLKYWLICEIFNLYPTGDFYHGIRQIQFEPIRRLGGTAEAVAHPWKVVAGASPDTWDMTGGVVFTLGQGLNVEVADTTLAGAEGDIILMVERDYATREVLSVTPQLVPSADIASASYQSRIVASVGGTPNILQRQFEDIRIFEELIVVNGEFKLATYEMSFYENYDLPV